MAWGLVSSGFAIALITPPTMGAGAFLEATNLALVRHFSTALPLHSFGSSLSLVLDLHLQTVHHHRWPHGAMVFPPRLGSRTFVLVTVVWLSTWLFVCSVFSFRFTAAAFAARSLEASVSRNG